MAACIPSSSELCPLYDPSPGSHGLDLRLISQRLAAYYFRLAKLSLIAKAALQEQRLDIPLILIPSRVHTKKQLYVLVMVDPDAPSHAHPTSAFWRHWLIVDIQGDALKNGQIQGTTLTDYYPPTPPQNSGFHRYQFMLFEQPSDTQVSLSEKEESSREKSLEGGQLYMDAQNKTSQEACPSVFSTRVTAGDLRGDQGVLRLQAPRP
ncbi:hypothetical protein Q8A73_012016 [Channa argus]|nr:hypothetical protein Q8A73_012016 [Channa argus]